MVQGGRPPGSASRARPQRPSDRVRRPEILATAVELVREQGLWAVRVADVAERAGISPSSVIYHFGTKDQLFEQAIADVDTAFHAGLRRELRHLRTGPERLACLIARSSASDWVLWMDLWVYARRHPEILAAVQALHTRWCETIAEVIRYGQVRGEFASADADGAAIRLAALTDGFAVHMVLEHPGHDREQYVVMLLQAAALELGCDPAALRRAAGRIRGADPAGSAG